MSHFHEMLVRQIRQHRVHAWEDVVERRIGETKMGFGAEVKGKSDKSLSELLKQVEPDDLMKYGLIPEFIGRIPVISALDELSEEALMTILTQPKNALMRQYIKLFDFEDVNLKITDDALKAVASEAIKRKSGARGLRAILEQIMLEVMYDVPSMEGVGEVVVNEDVITKKAKPLLVYEKDSKKKNKSA